MSLPFVILITWLILGAITLVAFKHNLKRQMYETFEKMLVNGTGIPYWWVVYTLLVGMVLIFWPLVWFGRVAK